MFRPTQINNLRTPATLLIPEYSKYNGVTKKTFPESGPLIYVNFKSKGGTETVVNGVYSVLNTAAGRDIPGTRSFFPTIRNF